MNCGSGHRVRGERTEVTRPCGCPACGTEFFAAEPTARSGRSGPWRGQGSAAGPRAGGQGPGRPDRSRGGPCLTSATSMRPSADAEITGSTFRLQDRGRSTARPEPPAAARRQGPHRAKSPSHSGKKILNRAAGGILLATSPRPRKGVGTHRSPMIEQPAKQRRQAAAQGAPAGKRPQNSGGGDHRDRAERKRLSPSCCAC